jgi:hypothetical protein
VSWLSGRLELGAGRESALTLATDMLGLGLLEREDRGVASAANIEVTTRDSTTHNSPVRQKLKLQFNSALVHPDV